MSSYLIHLIRQGMGGCWLYFYRRFAETIGKWFCVDIKNAGMYFEQLISNIIFNYRGGYYFWARDIVLKNTEKYLI